MKKTTTKLAAVLLAAACLSSPASADLGGASPLDPNVTHNTVGGCLPESQRSAFENMRIRVEGWFFENDPECGGESDNLEKTE